MLARIYDGQYPLTGIRRCPKYGADMVISRTVNILKDGTERRLVYYACGNWKTKGTSVCHSNYIRAAMAYDYVFAKITKLILQTNEWRILQPKSTQTEMIKSILPKRSLNNFQVSSADGEKKW